MALDVREGVTLKSTISGDLCFDSMDKASLITVLEKEFSFVEKDAVWQEFLYGRDPSIRELCDFVEKRL